MRKISNAELGRKSPEQYRQSEKLPVIIVLDNVRSLNNVGSVFRTADAFLVMGIYLCGITAIPPHREINKTALGATESVGWKYFKKTSEAIKELKSGGFDILCAEQAEGSVYLNDLIIDPNRKYAVVFGHEVNGISQEVMDECDLAVEIPQFGTKHSFNIAVSAGIVMWEIWKKLSSPAFPQGA